MSDYRSKYPKLIIDYAKLQHNCSVIINECKKRNISISGVVKGTNGIPECIKTFANAGCEHIATSRLDQIIDLKDQGLNYKYMLIRSPMLSEVRGVVKYVDCSLNSEKVVIEKINLEALKQNKIHNIILMADIGDLREGIWSIEEIIDLSIHIEKSLKNVHLIGVGTDLGCYGSIKPTYTKLDELCDLAKEIENAIGRKLEIISGGSTTSYPLVIDNDIPEYINNLRIGEGMLMMYDLQTLWGLKFENIYRDVFTFKAEVIEVKDKPSHPVGEIFIDGWGKFPKYTDRGIRKRAIIATGKLDFAYDDKIFPKLNGIEILGSCSDHTIIDIEECEKDLNVGDIIDFDLSYPPLMFLTNSRYIVIDKIDN